MGSEAGFTIGDVFYTFPTSFRLGDPVLVAEVTGLSWNEFAELLDQEDPRTLAGLVAVAVWQQNPTWRRDRVARFVESVDMTSMTFEGGGEDTDEANPPAAAGAAPAPTTSKHVSSTPISDDKTASDTPPESIGRPRSGIVAA